MQVIKGRYAIVRIIKNLLNQATCRHTHMFHLNLPQEHWLFKQRDGHYKDMGIHGQLQIRGCYICGKLWAHDYGA